MVPCFWSNTNLGCCENIYEYNYHLNYYLVKQFFFLSKLYVYNVVGLHLVC